MSIRKKLMSLFWGMLFLLFVLTLLALLFYGRLLDIIGVSIIFTMFMVSVAWVLFSKFSDFSEFSSFSKRGILIFILVFSYAFAHMCDYLYMYREQVKVGRFVLEESLDFPFNYTLFDTKDDNALLYVLVNDFADKGDYVYFSYIDGALLDDFCYYDPHLKLARINKLKDKIEYVPIQSHEEIFKLVNHLSKSEQQWLSVKERECSKLPKESDNE